MKTSKLLATVTSTPRLRLTLLTTIIWYVFVFNIERLNLGFISGVNISNVTYGIVIGMGIAILSFPNFSKISFMFVAGVAVAVFAGLTSLWGDWDRYDGHRMTLAFEVCIWLITYIQVRILNEQLLNLELGLQMLVPQLQRIPLMPPYQTYYRIQKELRRAARFKSQLVCIYCEVYQGNREEMSLPKLSDIHSYISYIVTNHYHRIILAKSITMLLYKSDLIMSYHNGYLIFLPETSQHNTLRFLSELASLIKTNEDLTLLAGEAHFPEDGNTFDTLAATVRSKVQVFTGDAISNSGAFDPDLWYESEEQLEWLEELGPSAQAIFQSSRSADSKARAGAVFVDMERRLEIEQRAAWVNNLAYQSASARFIYLPVKRLMDIVLVGLALPLVLPVALVVSLLIVLDDGFPVLYRQERTGYGGKRFNMYKFRSMKVNAAALPVKVVRTEDGEERPVWPEKNEADPRITRVGRILRKTSLDEIPQLLNVLIGDMSVVGPRPTSWNVDMYTLLQTERLNVKPGITGLWQVSERETKNFDERLLWDIKYVEKMSVWLDILIIWRTIAQVVRRKGV